MTIEESRLSPWTRLIATVLGFLLLVIAAYLLLLPPARTTIEADSSGQPTKTVRTDADLTTPAVIVLASAIGVWVFALNGLKFIRISVGPVSAETSSPERRAKQYYSDSKAMESTKEIPLEHEQVPESTEAPTATVPTGDGDVAVFPLSDVPSTVIRDALANWPNESELPDLVGDFEFAAKRRGKGNHPWTLKFRGRNAVRLSYGGQSKSSPTVKSS